MTRLSRSSRTAGHHPTRDAPPCTLRRRRRRYMPPPAHPHPESLRENRRHHQSTRFPRRSVCVAVASSPRRVRSDAMANEVKEMKYRQRSDFRSTGVWALRYRRYCRYCRPERLGLHCAHTHGSRCCAVYCGVLR